MLFTFSFAKEKKNSEAKAEDLLLSLFILEMDISTFLAKIMFLDELLIFL